MRWRLTPKLWLGMFLIGLSSGLPAIGQELEFFRGHGDWISGYSTSENRCMAGTTDPNNGTLLFMLAQSDHPRNKFLTVANIHWTNLAEVESLEFLVDGRSVEVQARLMPNHPAYLVVSEWAEGPLTQAMLLGENLELLGRSRRVIARFSLRGSRAAYERLFECYREMNPF